MIQLPNLALPEEILEQLRVYQADIVGTFSEKQVLVKSNRVPGFATRNKPNNSTFKVIRECEMCGFVDSVADEVEHIFPKDLFPDKCYEWLNYLYACGQCNGPKNNKFALFVENGEMLVLSPLVEPPQGTSVLINPRIENGMDFCRLNLKSFHFEI